MTPDFTTRDRSLLKPHGPYQLELGDPGNPEIIESQKVHPKTSFWYIFEVTLFLVRVASTLKPKNLSNRTLYEIMPADETEVQQRVAHFGENSTEPAIGHLGFISPSAQNVGRHWSIVVSRTDFIPGYFPFAKLTQKSYVSSYLATGATN